MGKIGFWQGNSSKDDEIPVSKAEYEKALDAYFAGNADSGRWTSQDIADNLRDTISITPNQVFTNMSHHGYKLRRDDDRLVWVVK